MPDAYIRAMTEKDLPVVAAIVPKAELSWHPEAIHQSLKSNHQCLVLVIDDVLLGFVITSVVCDEAEVLYIAIAQKERRKGWGGYLLQVLCQYLNKEKVCKVFLEVRSSNKGAFLLYKQCGFVETGRRKNYYKTVDGREDALVFSLSFS